MTRSFRNGKFLAENHLALDRLEAHANRRRSLLFIDAHDVRVLIDAFRLARDRVPNVDPPERSAQRRVELRRAVRRVRDEETSVPFLTLWMYETIPSIS